MSLSPFDRRLLSEGLDFFSRPRLATLLELLGANQAERVEALTTMLRNGSEDEVDEAVRVFDRALARVTREEERTMDERDRIGRSGRHRRRRNGGAAGI